MLEELASKQDNPEEARRWWSDDYFDIILWFTNAEINSFQICYDKNKNEYALLWNENKGFEYTKVDSGEAPYKMNKTPILLPAKNIDFNSLKNELLVRSKNMDDTIVTFILNKLDNAHTTSLE